MDDKAYYKDWKRLVNMPPSQINWFINTKMGKGSGLSEDKANKLRIRRGLNSAKEIIKMKAKPFAEWSENELDWMRAQVRFIKRMKGVRGSLMRDGKPTRKLRALWIWGHNPLSRSPREVLRGVRL